MERTEVLKKVMEICQDVFEDEELVITDDTQASDVEDWDSLTHLSLINEIEMEFDIKFTMAEVQGLENVGALIDTIMMHITSK